VLGAAAGSWAIWKYGYDGAGAVPALVLVAAGLVLAAVALPLLRLRSTLKLENGFGLCPGKRQPRHDTMALLDWMHAEVQACAGRKVDDPPLTFADLAEKNIQLRLMTTDLSAGRPVRLPLAEPNSIGRDPGSHDYVFRREELVPLLPDKLLEWLDKVSVAPPLAGGYRQLPGMDLPIALGARLSLSFPILLSAVRLHARVADGTYEARLFSDGGISSNFPIHFFDGWLPQRPTFGLDLIGPDPNASSNILMPSGPYAPLPRRWVDVSGLTGFAHQIFDSARNWRDTLQMELPGFRERVCHIRLTEDEGGLNLNMSPTTVRALLDRGEAAGYAILSEFSWSQHTWERFRLLSALLEQNLKDAESGDGWAQYHALLAREQFDGFAYADGLDAVWRASADAQFKALLDLAASWGTDGQVSFGAGDLPLPYPTMRISPDV
jgi:hypothetical protein